MIPEPGEGFVRLSPLKLLLDPVKAVAQAVVPVVIALVGISRSDTKFWPIILPLVVLGPLVLGALPWLTTHYRLTGTQIQVRSGILNKKTSTAPLDRVRSVDLEASLLHRILGLQKVQIGTGVDDDRITLDALAAADAQALRTTLLTRRAVAEQQAAQAIAGQPDDLSPDQPDGPAPARCPGDGGRTGGAARADRLVLAALRTLQPRPAGAAVRRARGAVAVRRRPPHLERGDGHLGVAVAHPVRRRGHRARALRQRTGPVAGRLRRRLRPPVVGLPARARARLAAPHLRAGDDAVHHGGGGEGPRGRDDRAGAHATRRWGRALHARHRRGGRRHAGAAAVPARGCRRGRRGRPRASRPADRSARGARPEGPAPRVVPPAPHRARRHRAARGRLVVVRPDLVVARRHRRRAARPRRCGGRGVVPPPRARPRRRPPRRRGRHLRPHPHRARDRRHHRLGRLAVVVAAPRRARRPDGHDGRGHRAGAGARRTPRRGRGAGRPGDARACSTDFVERV